MRWRTGNNRRAKRQHSNALTITVWCVDGTVSSRSISPLPNAHERAMLAFFEREAKAAGDLR